MNVEMQPEKIRHYSCQNGAFHANFCCNTCWNRHPETLQYEDRCFDKRFLCFIQEEKERRFLEAAGISGFSEKQANFLLKCVVFQL